VTGSKVDLSDWLVRDRPKRRASVVKSPDASQVLPSQSDCSQHSLATGSEFSMERSFADDVTEDGDDDETSQRSGATATGVVDSQETEESYDEEEEKKKRKKAKKKASKKARRREVKKQKKEDKGRSGRSAYDSPSY